MREEKFHIYLNDDEYSRVIQTLIRLKKWSQDDGTASLIKGAVSFDTPAQKDIDYWCEQGRSRDQNVVTGQMPFNEFWAELASDLTDYMNGAIDMNTLIERSNSRSGVCGF